MITNIFQYLEANAARFEHKIALSDEKSEVSFGQWLDYAKRIGSSIIKDATGEMRRPVMVFVDRRIEPLVAFLGVVASGNFYVPIDCKMPPERLKYIIGVLNPLAAITITPADELLLDAAEYAGRRYQYDAIVAHMIDAQALGIVQRDLIDLDPVYAIFTSGSTGVPKGVLVPHRGMIDLGEWIFSTFDMSSNDVIGNQSPFYFDGSVKDILLCLKGGATLHVIPRKCFSFPKLLMKFLNEKRVTTVWWSTSAIILAANSGVLDINPPQSIRIVTFGGESILPKQLNCWRKVLPQAKFVNLYGPTEVSVDSTYYVVDREFGEDETIPIGRHCENKSVLVLTEDGKLAQQGEIGELCMRGTGCSLGYYNAPEKTAAAFVQNPLHNLYEDRIYRTGDLVKYNERGELIFVSRKDFQIKHMGYRIELGEIEAAVNAIDGVSNAACIYDAENERIVLYYTTTDGQGRDIFNLVRARLPKYMYPELMIRLDAMPFNANGKIDRVALKKNFSKEENNE